MPPKARLLTGKIVVFTGALSMPRATAKAMAERSGGTVVSTVTAACNVIVAGPGAGSKLAKAQGKGVEVWDEAEFLRRMTVEEHAERLGENKGRVIEETGKEKFQFSLAWDALVDLDLHLKTPQGEVSYMRREVAGATLDVDRMPQMEDSQQKQWRVMPVENIVCDRAHPGQYECTVELFGRGAMGFAPPGTKVPAVPYTVHCRVASSRGRSPRSRRRRWSASSPSPRTARPR